MPSKLRTRLGQHEFTLRTTLSVEEILKAAERAEHVAEPTTDGTVVRAATRPDGIAYQVTTRGDLFALTFALTWTDCDDGARLVRLAVGDYLTTRTTWLRAPIGPRIAPGLASLARFSDWMHKELDANGRVGVPG